MKRIILASGSPRRLELMHQAGFEVEVIPSHSIEKISGSTPEEVVQRLSRQKAEDVAQMLAGKVENTSQIPGGEGINSAQRVPNNEKNTVDASCIILGADTIVVRDAEILGKPADRAHAIAMLQSLSGRSHDVYTGVTLAELQDGTICREDTFAVRTKVYVCSMTDQEICDYVDSGDPMDKAGGYGIQGIFARFVEKIDGDYYNVVGLPVSEVYHRLKNWMD
ncbi:MAG: Maf family protein [Eubacterium sp.]|nr:Maf family protein [Eubacterium sp.]